MHPFPHTPSWSSVSVVTHRDKFTISKEGKEGRKSERNKRDRLKDKK
jgi:hypothetical protein